MPYRKLAAIIVNDFRDDDFVPASKDDITALKQLMSDTVEATLPGADYKVSKYRQYDCTGGGRYVCVIAAVECSKAEALAMTPLLVEAVRDTCDDNGFTFPVNRYSY